MKRNHLTRKFKIKSSTDLDIDSYVKVLRWFFAYPNREIGLNDLSAAVEIAKTTANRVVTELQKEGFLKVEILGRVWRISAVVGHPFNTTQKVPYSMSLIYSSGIMEKIHEIVPNPRNIILFGSYRLGEDDENSDIDIAVEVMDDQALRIHELGVIPRLGYRKNVTVNLHIFTRNQIDLNLFSNIANGIILEGFLEVRP